MAKLLFLNKIPVTHFLLPYVSQNTLRIEASLESNDKVSDSIYSSLFLYICKRPKTFNFS